MDREAIAEMFSAFGPVASKRMFSGFGLWSEGVCFCLVLRGGEFYLKADALTIPQFEDNGCKPFSYTQPSSGKVVSVNSFWRMPERLYDDPDELAEWARAAVGAAHRAQLAKGRRSRPKSPAGKPAKAAVKTAPSKARKKPAKTVSSTSSKPASKRLPTGAKRSKTKTKVRAVQA